MFKLELTHAQTSMKTVLLRCDHFTLGAYTHRSPLKPLRHNPGGSLRTIQSAWLEHPTCLPCPLTLKLVQVILSPPDPYPFIAPHCCRQKWNYRCCLSQRAHNTHPPYTTEKIWPQVRYHFIKQTDKPQNIIPTKISKAALRRNFPN